MGNAVFCFSVAVVASKQKVRIFGILLRDGMGEIILKAHLELRPQLQQRIAGVKVNVECVIPLIKSL